MVVSMMYYGLSLNSGNLNGDMHINFLLSGLVEIPAYSCLLWALNRLGRRSLHSSMMIVGGLACVSTLFPVLYGDEGAQPEFFDLLEVLAPLCYFTVACKIRTCFGVSILQPFITSRRIIGIM